MPRATLAVHTVARVHVSTRQVHLIELGLAFSECSVHTVKPNTRQRSGAEKKIPKAPSTSDAFPKFKHFRPSS